MEQKEKNPAAVALGKLSQQKHPRTLTKAKAREMQKLSVKKRKINA